MNYDLHHAKQHHLLTRQKPIDEANVDSLLTMIKVGKMLNTVICVKKLFFDGSRDALRARSGDLRARKNA